ncbi:hypothetical protein KJ059_10460 [Myxococcota bacterium]|nr:hypothetical protein [Myxococcota bacterium]MCZ7619135.1 hypothetical protein [Myxococcota bacterium]
MRILLWPGRSSRQVPFPVPFAIGTLALTAALAWPAPASAISGVCPDGSVFIVRRAADVPCREARRVEPHRVPPIRPENLPRPYLWEVHRQGIDPSNPYNLVDRAEQVRTLGNADLETGAVAPSAAGAPPPAGASLPPVAAAPPPPPPPASGPRPSDLGLTDGELRDLFLLVELSQRRAPAVFLRSRPDAAGDMRVSMAYSQAFQERVANAGGAGSVLLFTVEPETAGRFLPNFSFVQGHLTFSPQREDPAQIGILSGRVGDLSAGDLVLGYVVLPESIDVTRPLDVYWDDRQVVATFRP